MKEIKKAPGRGLLLGNGSERGLSALDIYGSTKSESSQYPPGWLIARLRQAPPTNPITRRQGMALHNLIQTIGLATYRSYKTRLGIPLDLPLHRLTKGQAWQLIHTITTDLEAAR